MLLKPDHPGLAVGLDAEMDGAVRGGEIMRDTFRPFDEEQMPSVQVRFGTDHLKVTPGVKPEEVEMRHRERLRMIYIDEGEAGAGDKIGRTESLHQHPDQGRLAGTKIALQEDDPSRGEPRRKRGDNRSEFLRSVHQKFLRHQSPSHGLVEKNILKKEYYSRKLQKQAPMTAINQERLVTTFMELAAIPSPSFAEADVFRYCAAALAPLGYTTELLAYDRGQNLHASCGESAPGFVPLLLSAHADTVLPCAGVRPVLQDGVIRSAGDTVLGADNKAALAVFLEVARTLHEYALPHGRLDFLISSAEEIGLYGACAFDYSRIPARHCLVFDASGDPGLVVNRAPGHTRFILTIHGRKAHAGIEPEKGINAFTTAGRLLSMIRIGRLDRDTVANWGLIAGGTAANIIPDLVTLEGEVRSHKPDGRRRFLDRVRQCMARVDRKTGTRSVLEIINEYGPFSVPPTDPLVRAVEASCHQTGLPFRCESSGGCSDANIIHGKGITCLNLACGMRQVHTVEEHILVRDLAASARLLLELVTEGLRGIPAAG